MLFITNAHDTHSRNRCHKSTPFFWRRFLVRVSCKSQTGFFWYQIPAPIRTMFYSKPESGVHVTEMMTCDWSMIIVDVFMCCEVVLCGVAICLFIKYFQPCLFLAPEVFIPNAHGLKKRRQKLELIYENLYSPYSRLHYITETFLKSRYTNKQCEQTTQKVQQQLHK